MYTRLSLSMVCLSKHVLLIIKFVTFRLACRLINLILTTPMLHDRQLTSSHHPLSQRDSRFRSLLHNIGLDSFLFARHYSGNKRLFSFLAGTERFHFPAFPPKTAMNSLFGNQVWTWLGYPIRKSPDQSLFDSSPRLIAAYHVLLRSFAPRHSPYALIWLHWNYYTIQF